MDNPRVVFAGTPEFALASLKALVEAGVVPVAVLTQPDRPAGRGKRLTASPVKRFAEQSGIPVLQPATLREASAVDGIAALSPDLIVVAAYGLILPQEVLDLPALGCVNVHASVLPRWRGAAPVQAAILAGDRQTGVSLMSMTSGLDCGPVYVSEAFDIGEHETAGELSDRLAALGGELLVRNLDRIVLKQLRPVEQDESRATYAGKIGKRDAVIDWRRSADELQRLVRAYNPVPGARFALDSTVIKCWRATALSDASGEPGTIVASGRDGVVVACGEGALRMESLQRPGRRPVTAREFSASADLDGRILA